MVSLVLLNRTLRVLKIQSAIAWFVEREQSHVASHAYYTVPLGTKFTSYCISVVASYVFLEEDRKGALLAYILPQNHDKITRF